MVSYVKDQQAGKKLKFYSYFYKINIVKVPRANYVPPPGQYFAEPPLAAGLLLCVSTSFAHLEAETFVKQLKLSQMHL